MQRSGHGDRRREKPSKGRATNREGGTAKSERSTALADTEEQRKKLFKLSKNPSLDFYQSIHRLSASLAFLPRAFQGNCSTVSKSFKIAGVMLTHEYGVVKQVADFVDFSHSLSTCCG